MRDHSTVAVVLVVAAIASSSGLARAERSDTGFPAPGISRADIRRLPTSGFIREALLTSQLTPEDKAGVSAYLRKHGRAPYTERTGQAQYVSPWHEGLFRETGVLPKSLRNDSSGWVKELDARAVLDNTSRIMNVRGRTQTFRLSELYRDDDLFNRYRRIGKDLGNVRVKVIDNPASDTFGMYVRANGPDAAGEITINTGALRKDRIADRNFPDTPRSVLVHEIQHMLDHLDKHGKTDEFRADVSGYREGKPLAERRRVPPNQLFDPSPNGYVGKDASYSLRRPVDTQTVLIPASTPGVTRQLPAITAGRRPARALKPSTPALFDDAAGR